MTDPTTENGATAASPSPWRWVIGLIVSALFLWVAFRQVADVSTVGTALLSANYIWMIPAIALYLAGLWVRAWRWRVLLAPVADIPTTSMFGILSIGFLVNNVLPARLGEIARAVIAGRRHRVSRSATLATVVVERIFDGIVMLLFLGVSTASAGQRVGAEWLTLLVPMTAIGFGGAGLALGFLAFAPGLTLGIAARILAPLPTRAREAALDVAGKFITGLGVLQDLKLAGAVLLSSIVAWLLEAGVYVAVGQSFGLMTDPLAYLLAVSVANLGTMIPSSPGYVGTFDALVARSLAFYGIGDAIALAYAFALHLAIWLPPTVLGLVYLWRYNLRLTRLTGE